MTEPELIWRMARLLIIEPSPSRHVIEMLAVMGEVEDYLGPALYMAEWAEAEEALHAHWREQMRRNDD